MKPINTPKKRKREEPKSHKTGINTPIYHIVKGKGVAPPQSCARPITLSLFCRKCVWKHRPRH